MKLPLDERTTICTSKDGSFDYFPMKGKVLEPYEDYTASLVNFLFKSYGIRIEMIAVDFIKDERDMIYFVDVNGFKVADYNKICRLALMNED